MSAAKPRCPKGWRRLRAGEILRYHDRCFWTTMKGSMLMGRVFVGLKVNPKSAPSLPAGYYIRRIPEARQ